ncbi:beta-ketoacyl-ACP synthase III [Clostridium omnivorum]|uniref:Beta-ketoacyl-[acyl-carrier-protein] synthase III n=1 Tax=Clostridium omnivorum TaxID=1604902 RepID=A0ABQ5N3T0_9CLOT|nr:beta-ketoacyl-ACP synthase III [Clostridium sp. E14]GLC29867.1 3-oxoacyl-[acyl-carrier-protein] synthase 3 [Clostridium sp. E14]
MKEVKIIGIGSGIPDNIMTNDDLSKIVDTSDEWITTRTGIKERRISKGENTSDLAAKAVMKALKMSDTKPEEIDMIILSTSSPDALSPSTACFVQDKIGAVNASCFDISAACSGFVYALRIGAQFIKTGECKKVLVIGAEVLSKITDWTDRSTCVLFGDGAGAAVLAESDEKGVSSIFTGAQGNKAGYLGITCVPVKNPLVKPEEIENIKLHMDGKEVFRFASSIVIEAIDKVLKDSGLTMDDIKYVIPHQANVRIIEYAVKKLKAPEGKFYINLDKYGNTSAASIPIALAEMNEKGLIKKGDKLILVAFGAGFTWSACLVEWNI